MKAQIIKRSDLEQIYNIACKDWKLKIEQYAKRTPFGDEIQLTGEEIGEMFAASDIEQKKVLDKFFVREKKIKTFADACEACGMSESLFNSIFSSINISADIVSYAKLKIITKALNGGWVPNWKDSSEYRYYPYFKMSPFGFGGADYVDWATDSYTGSHLCFKSKELATYAGEQFQDIYKDFMV